MSDNNYDEAISRIELLENEIIELKEEIKKLRVYIDQVTS